MRCEFEDDICEKCLKQVKEIYFRPTVSGTEGQYWCLECIKAEESDNEAFGKEMQALPDAGKLI
jgi:hypothetical protein